MHRAEPTHSSSAGASSQTETASRRRFLQLLSAVPAVPWTRALLPGLAAATAAGKVAAQTTETPKAPAEVRAFVEIIKSRWGERLSAENLQEIEESLGWMQRSSAALREVPLQNADEPDVIFRAEPPEAHR